MALDGYVPVTMNEGDELCADDIGQLITNLTAIRDAAGTTSDSVYCQEISENINTPDGCVMVESPLKDPDGFPSGEIDTKLITFTYSVDYLLSSSDSENINAYATSKIIVSCGGAVIYETGQNECSTGQPISFVTQCPRDDDIEFCLEMEVVSPSILTRITRASAAVCGAILCIGSRKRNIDGFFNYYNFDPQCCYGRDALCMISQNAESLRFDLSSNCDQVATCNTVTVTDEQSVPLFQNIQRGAIYLVTGSIRVCAFTSNPSGQDQFITVKPFIGCEGEQSSCATVQGILPGREEGEPAGRTRCFRVPVIQCGVCETGQTLFAGLTQFVDCETIGQDGVFGDFLVDIEVEQDYCAWLFEKVSLDGLPDPFTATLGQCLASDYTESLAAFVDTLHQFVCDRSPVQLTNLTPSLPNEYIVSGGQYSSTTTIIAPDPNPAAPKKWTVNFSFRPVYSRVDSSLAKRAEFTVTFRCGANVLFTETVDWTISTLGGVSSSRNAGPCISFAGCLECDPNDGMTVTIETGPGTAVGTYTAQPLKLNLYCF